MRTEYCGLISTRTFLDQTVMLCGWVHRRRDHGGVIFIDLRDREGLVQVVCDPDNAATFATAEKIRNEFVVKVTGLVRRRPAGTINRQPHLGRNRSAGAFHRGPEHIRDAAVPDGRRQPVRELCAWNTATSTCAARRCRRTCACATRWRWKCARYLDEQGFIDIETPMLTKIDAGRRARLPGAVARECRHVLRAAAVAAAVQAIAHGLGLRPLLPDHQMLPRRRPARRPPARIYPDRLRNLLPRRRGNPRTVRRDDPRHVFKKVHERRLAGSVPGDGLADRRWPSTAPTSPTCGSSWKSPSSPT